MTKARVQVSPASGVPKRVLRDLAREFPEVLLVLHPLFRVWQAYEAKRESFWDADRLRHAILAEHGRAAFAPSTKWWWERGAPRIFDSDVPSPGEWTIEWLRQRELHRVGGAKAFLEQMEQRSAKLKADAAKDRHAENLGKAEEFGKSVRDSMPTGVSITDNLKKIRARERRAEIVA